MALTELEARIDELRRTFIGRKSDKNPSIVAVGETVGRELRELEAARLGGLYLPETMTLGSRVCGLHVFEDPELEPDAIEVR